jgi:O-methyltransferase
VTSWDCKSEYLDLVKLSLIDVLGHETLTARRRSGGGMEISTLPEENRFARIEGRDWPANAMTMIGMARLNHLQACVEEVIAAGVSGDLIETGVWRGGATILMRAILRAHGVSDRTVWAADSFEGLPPPSADRYPADAGSELHEEPFLTASLDEVKRNFQRYGMLDEQVRFVKGWFRDTLPALRDRQWSVIRLDGDLYESTIDSLEHLYPQLSAGGYLVIDDYGVIPRCRQAVHDYRAEHGIREEIQPIDWSGVYWRKQVTN